MQKAITNYFFAAITIALCGSLTLYNSLAKESSIMSKKVSHIEIFSKTVEYDAQNKIAKFIDEVEAYTDDSYISADTMIVHFKEEHNSSTIQNNADKIEKVELIGNVYAIRGDSEIWGDTGEYNLQKDAIIMHGNVKIKQEQNEMHGDTLVHSLKSQQTLLKSENNRVKATIIPQEK
jgi:lipopolysaccharide transport protein LptA